MNKEWYKINVKQEVLKDIKHYLNSNKERAAIIEGLKKVSVRDMMDFDFINTITEIKDAKAFSQFVNNRYMYYRSEKYGQEYFWNAAASERNIGYKGDWHEYITKLLMKYCSRGDKVFFIGTADGSEIPFNSVFKYYALEQIGDSAKRISRYKVVSCFEADFEDDSFVVEGGNIMNAIVALRCLMPNTRLNRFLKFVENNLIDHGVLIVSHPMGYLDANCEYKALPDCKVSRLDFDNRLKEELIKRNNMRIVYEEETTVEYFYVIEVRYADESFIN